ncbi:MAG: PIN domain nuclease [Epsilonproteobacteria bacterium]|nr:MAG: PIN domain nuclease [Campylobacterota bacterium]
MVSLIDTNIIIRFLVRDNEEHFIVSKEIFEQVQLGVVKVEILSEVLMEVLFVMTKVYKIPKNIVIEKLKTLLLLEGVVNDDKAICIDALNLMQNKNIDYVDALICTKNTLQGYGKISFDKDVMKKCEK